MVSTVSLAFIFHHRYKVSLTTVLNSGFLDEWLTLEDVPSGRLHLRLERLTPRPTAAELEEVRERGAGLGRVHPLVSVHQSASRVPGCQSRPQPARCVSPGAAGEQPDPDSEEFRAGSSPAVRLPGAGRRSAGKSQQPYMPRPIGSWPAPVGS